MSSELLDNEVVDVNDETDAKPASKPFCMGTITQDEHEHMRKQAILLPMHIDEAVPINASA